MPEHVGRTLKKNIKNLLKRHHFMTISIAGVIVSAARHRNVMATCSPAGQTIAGDFSLVRRTETGVGSLKFRSENIEISLDSPGKGR